MKNEAEAGCKPIVQPSIDTRITEIVNKYPDLNFVPLMRLVSSDTSAGELEDFFNKVAYALAELLKDEESFTPHYIMQMLQQLRQLADVMREVQGRETWYYTV